MEGLKGLAKNKWVWIGVGLVALLAVLNARKKGKAGGPIPTENPEAFRIAGQGMAQGAADQGSLIDRFMEQMQLKSLGQQQELSDISFQQEKARQSLLDRIFQALSTPGKQGAAMRKELSREGIKCPVGKMRIDPQTGQVYCREKTGKPFFSQLIAGIPGRAQQVANIYTSGGY